ncbi:B3/4 domain-containing protein [Nonomuraea sp. NPDC051941]|uniref:B3/4 domain-containing protein n=1 Tax=Nonomuraea sp. NPDC051941 TaxID=3364373 RepID=UPI0037CCB419
MRLIISEDIRKSFPDLRIALLVARDIDNTGLDPELQEQKRSAASRMYENFTYDTLNARTEIEAWREAYRAFGVKPRDSRPTAEAFLRRLVKGDDFPTISKAVDSYLLVETQYFLPVGGYDLSEITGDIVLRFSSGGEPFVPIGAAAEEMTKPGEVIYADDARVLTRKWNFRDCDTCKITDASTTIGLFTEAPFASVQTKALTDSIQQMADYIQKYCGGTVKTAFLDTSMMEIDIP